ncbi:hypothetical protein ACFODZ_02770 [Marinicella sediminis]|uniref:Uncharacterized protein n=1 Tax=Marinicella sediminis TaxID=1792834 RepID=A0ABV7J7M1_9GAMM|nr:hypothetical protein [Marinicella sediminis]
MEVFLSLMATLVVLRYSFGFFFQNLDDFTECVRFWFTPEIISIFRGEWERDWWAELRIFFWLLLGIASGYGAHLFLTS